MWFILAQVSDVSSGIGSTADMLKNKSEATTVAYGCMAVVVLIVLIVLLFLRDQKKQDDASQAEDRTLFRDALKEISSGMKEIASEQRASGERIAEHLRDFKSALAEFRTYLQTRRPDS